MMNSGNTGSGLGWRRMVRAGAGCACLMVLLATRLPAQDVAAEQLLPQNLLGLVHAAEVQAEIKLTADQQRQLDRLFVENDGVWFRARIQPPETQRTIIGKLESRVREWLARSGTAEQQKRLKQLELQSLGGRVLLHPDVVKSLKMDADQQAKVLALARGTHSATEKLQEAVLQRKSTEALQQALRKSTEDEQTAFTTVLRPEQVEKLKLIVGQPFETAQLKRIYPKAPELVPVEEWINSSPLTLAGLRGKVVIVHFYAFQCHNCHANFEHYTKWHQEFGDDVVVIGIQTPETSAESDPKQVRKAATERGFKYPVIIDLEKKNWDAWANTMWPCVYVVDQDGYLRHWWQGELNWEGAKGDQVIRDVVQGLLKKTS